MEERASGRGRLSLAGPGRRARAAGPPPGRPPAHHLEVVRERRNEGIGTQLLRAAEQRLHTKGHRRVALGVNLDNHAAQRLYSRLGYTEWPHGKLATTETVYHPGGRRELRPEVCLVMVRHLG
ncbi:GNAT family N-acetyltransferase [Nonomuraea basaltis]|uniref:GNAT family N-acetyltransferase n=1 Tax=Nonomuraea basaltis TaxID=2495887 RepID=UPI00110C6DFB|nr:GNAT family N-acetyltransferase [Nonomuraea basaltis]TMR95409.1 GNAT family N-acetyltransferase [Nonomuraea basaltis]